MKAISLFILSVLSVIGIVIAQEKTLRVETASFKTFPQAGEVAETTDPDVSAAFLTCTIEEDDISFYISLSTPDLQRLLGDIQFLPLRGPANLFAITRRNDQIPLPKAIRNPNPGSRPGTNDDLERIVRAGGNREDYVPDEFVLDRPFILDIAYQSGSDYFVGKLEIPPEQIGSVSYHFTNDNLNMRFPMRLINPRPRR